MPGLSLNEQFARSHAYHTNEQYSITS